MAKTEELLEAKKAAHILDCSPDDVLLWRQRGELEGVKKGRFWRFRISDIHAFKGRRGGIEVTGFQLNKP